MMNMTHDDSFSYARSWKTILDAIEHHAATQGNKTAFIFLSDGEEESDQLTYGQLRESALAVASMLTETCPPGERALLVYPPGLEFISAFLGCLYAGVIAVPMYAPHPRRFDHRLAAIAADCRPAVILSNCDTLQRCGFALDTQDSLSGVRRMATNEVATTRRNIDYKPAAADTGFVQYTSGSTASPRGVCVTHANLLTNILMIRQAFFLDVKTICASWLPTHHDMGLIGDTLVPLSLGGLCVKMPPAAFLQCPRRWLSAITRYKATFVGAPNFAYDLCVQRITSEERNQFDLSSLRATYCGSEPIRAKALLDFAGAFEPRGFDATSFIPCYGMAETTLLTSGGPPMRPLVTSNLCPSALGRHTIRQAENGDHATVVGCGRPGPGAEILTVHPEELEPCGPSEVGELWIAGPHVAAGYWNNAESTERTFRARLRDGRGPYLRTGDLGFIRDGEVFITGRLKDIIIVRGQNHYPQDIEHTAQTAHPTLRTCMGAAFGVTSDGGEGLVIVQEIARTASRTDMDESKREVHRKVIENHGISPRDVLIVRWGTIPKTTSGKVRRGACRDAYLAGQLIAGADGQSTGERQS